MNATEVRTAERVRLRTILTHAEAVDRERHRDDQRRDQRNQHGLALAASKPVLNQLAKFVHIHPAGIDYSVGKLAHGLE